MATETTSNAVDQLTKRQRQVLTLIGNGKMSKEIAEELGIAIKTVEKHRISLYQRLNIHSVGEAVRLALTSGL